MYKKSVKKETSELGDDEETMTSILAMIVVCGMMLQEKKIEKNRKSEELQM